MLIMTNSNIQTKHMQYITQSKFKFVVLIKMKETRYKIRIIGDLDSCTRAGGGKHSKRQRAGFTENLGIILNLSSPLLTGRSCLDLLEVRQTERGSIFLYVIHTLFNVYWAVRHRPHWCFSNENNHLVSQENNMIQLAYY